MRLIYSYLGFSLVLCWGCGDPIRENIEIITAGGENQQEAVLQLVLAKEDIVPSVLEAYGDTGLPASSRILLLEVLARRYMGESDPRILATVEQAFADPSPEVRAKAAHVAGSLKHKEMIHPLLAQLAMEDRETVQLPMLETLAFLDNWRVEGRGQGRYVIPGGASLNQDQKNELVQVLQRIHRSATGDELRRLTVEFLEMIAAQVTQAGAKLILKGDLDGAERAYEQALAIKPDSKNANLRLGKLLFFNDRRSRGLEILKQHGLLMHIPRLSNVPTIDGTIDEPAWSQAYKLTDFYQNMRMMSALKAEGKSEVYIGYTDRGIYLGVKGYEESTEGLVAEHTQRDVNLWTDDCIEVFFDTDLDQRFFYQVLVNSLGTVLDVRFDASSINVEEARRWDGVGQVATVVADTYWSVELEIPFARLGITKINKGDVWGFNAIRTRIKGGEQGGWVPTYGFTGRPDLFGLMIFN